MKLRSLFVILAMSCTVAYAQQKIFQDWFVIPADDSSGDVIAATAIVGGDEILGVRCMVKDQTCVHVLMTSSKCDVDVGYPILMNAATGAYSINGTCLKGNQLVLAPFDSVRRSIVNTPDMIGFAIPMASGAFRAVRFSTKGSSAAIQEAERFVRDGRQRNNQNRPGAVTL